MRCPSFVQRLAMIMVKSSLYHTMRCNSLSQRNCLHQQFWCLYFQHEMLGDRFCIRPNSVHCNLLAEMYLNHFASFVATPLVEMFFLDTLQGIIRLQSTTSLSFS